MAIVRWKPFNDLVSVQDEINRAVGEFWRHSNHDLTARGAWWPAVDVVETENEFKVLAELPGMKKEAVKISLTDNVLTLRGEKRMETEVNRDNWHQAERNYGAFERSFHLACPVDAGKVKARFESGVLTVVLPKSEEAKPREIEIDM